MPFVPPEAQRLHAMNFDESLTMLLYGGPGVGKTYFAGTAGDRTLYLDIGHGVVTLASPAFTKKHKSNPLVLQIPLAENSYDYLTDSIDWFVEKRKAEFDTIVVDEVTALRRHAMQKAIGINSDLNKSTTLAQSKKHGIVTPTLPDWGEEMSVIEHFIASYTEICKQENLNFLVVAHEKLQLRKGAKIGDAPTVEKIRPAFTGQQFPDNVIGYFDEVWRFEAVGRGENKKYRITTQPNEKLVGKTRHGGVFKEIEENLDFPTVVSRIKSMRYVPDENDSTMLVAVK
jgi:hypothetical protein